MSQWESSLDWTTLRFLLDGDANTRVAKGFVPYCLPGPGPSHFIHGIQKVFLPDVSEEQFTADGLDVERFIDALKMSNQLRQEQLSIEIVKTAVEQFALKRFPTAAPGLVEQFKAQVGKV